MMRRALFAFAIAVLALPALAQGEDRGAPMGRFDFYVLSLSWSETFCNLTGRARGSQQCERNNPGFVLHGLWPQYERGHPAFCGPDGRNPSRDAMDRAARIFPDQGLARHEWRKHGTCSGLSPAAYFDAASAALSKVKIPDALLAPRRSSDWDVMEIERAFVASNPGLRADMIAVGCKRSMLEEVRICFTKDLRSFRPCPEVDQKACRTRFVSVPSTR